MVNASSDGNRRSVWPRVPPGHAAAGGFVCAAWRGGESCARMDAGKSDVRMDRFGKSVHLP